MIKNCSNCNNVLEFHNRLCGYIFYCNHYSGDKTGKIQVPNRVNGETVIGIEVYNESIDCKNFKELKIKE